MSKVQNGLNPIKEIIFNLYDVGELSVNEIYRRKTKKKGKKYLDFLKSLNYIAIKDEKVGEYALKLGACDYITKPIDLDDLEKSVYAKLLMMAATSPE